MTQGGGFPLNSPMGVNLAHSLSYCLYYELWPELNQIRPNCLDDDLGSFVTSWMSVYVPGVILVGRPLLARFTTVFSPFVYNDLIVIHL